MNSSKKIIIPDASVIIKWIAQDEYDENAEKFREDFYGEKVECIIPSLCLWEMSNYFSRKFPLQAMTHFSFFMLFGFKEAHLSHTIANLSFQIVNNCKEVTFYDASYHALALEAGGIYLTADRKYFHAAKKWKGIQLLQDYGNW